MPVNALRVGARVNEFEITGLVGEGGFGIVYLAFDHSLHRVVALKEYMPSALAERVGGVTVAVRSERQQATFAAGLRSFVNEARLLAQFDHPALVKVYRFWEGNGTAYMAMPYYEGRTLKQALRDDPDYASEATLKSVFGPVLDALELLHRNHCYHRDVSPDNVMILHSGAPVLLDFGAARRIIGDLTQGITVILKPGYAPIEQYADDSDLRQGPWTDVYAVAAVLYAAIVGKPPPTSVARIVKDPLEPLQGRGLDGYDPSFLAAIDHGLGVRPENRPQSIPEFRAALGLEVTTRTGSASSPGFVIGIAPRTGDASSAATVLPTAPLPPDLPTRLPEPITADSRDTPTLAGGWAKPIHADLDAVPGVPRRRDRLPLVVIGTAAMALLLVVVAILWRGGDTDRAPVAAADTAKGKSEASSGAAESVKSTDQPVSEATGKPPSVAFPDGSRPPPLASQAPASPPGQPSLAPPVAPAPVTASPAPPVAGDDDLAWESIQRSCLEQGFIGFVFRFPDSPHVTEAKRRLVELQEGRPCAWARGGSASDRPAGPRGAAQKEKVAADKAAAAQREKAAAEKAAVAQREKAAAEKAAIAQREKAAAEKVAIAQREKAAAEKAAAEKVAIAQREKAAAEKAAAERAAAERAAIAQREKAAAEKAAIARASSTTETPSATRARLQPAPAAPASASQRSEPSPAKPAASLPAAAPPSVPPAAPAPTVPEYRPAMPPPAAVATAPAAPAEAVRRPPPPAIRPEGPAAPVTAPPKEPPAPLAMGAATAALSLQVRPWGEVYVNGVLRGVTPPLKVIELSEGRHVVEIRNPGFASHRRELDIKRPERISLSHEFK